jgi:hypothetical protein
MSDSNTCTNTLCSKTATYEVTFTAVPGEETYGFCDEHYHELKDLEMAYE